MSVCTEVYEVLNADPTSNYWVAEFKIQSQAASGTISGPNAAWSLSISSSATAPGIMYSATPSKTSKGGQVTIPVDIGIGPKGLDIGTSFEIKVGGCCLVGS